MSRTLIWGIIRLCRWNIMGDMTKSKNADFQKMSIYVMKMQRNGKWKKLVFRFFDDILGNISPKKVYNTSN